MREYETGATRDNCDDKPDYEGFLSPLVIVEFGKYMHKHRKQADGKMRDSDNWQKGMPQTDYIKSMWRHFLDVWLHHRGFVRIARESLNEALCALIFNAQGYLHEQLKKESQEFEAKKELWPTRLEHPCVKPEDFNKMFMGNWEKELNEERTGRVVLDNTAKYAGLTGQEQPRDSYRPECDCCMCRKARKETW